MVSEEEIVQQHTENLQKMRENTNIIRNIIDANADKQDAKYANQPNNILPGDFVKVATYTKSGEDIHPIVLQNIRNPLYITVNGQRINITNVKARKIK